MAQRKSSVDNVAAGLLADCKQLIEEAKQAAIVAVNANLTLMYWQVGKRI